MPTDIALSTNSPTAALELRQVQPMPGDAGHAMFLVVRSGGFAAAVPFFAGGAAWDEFARALDGVTAGDGAPARLRSLEGDDVIALAGAGEGLIAVSGTLHDAHDDQLLRFRFIAPADGLPSLIAGVRRVARG